MVQWLKAWPFNVKVIDSNSHSCCHKHENDEDEQWKNKSKFKFNHGKQNKTGKY